MANLVNFYVSVQEYTVRIGMKIVCVQYSHVELIYYGIWQVYFNYRELTWHNYDIWTKKLSTITDCFLNRWEQQ